MWALMTTLIVYDTPRYLYQYMKTTRSIDDPEGENSTSSTSVFLVLTTTKLARFNQLPSYTIPCC